MKTKIVKTFDFLSDVFGILFAITAFAPGAVLDYFLPCENNRIRDIVVIALGLLVFAPLNLILYFLERICEAIADYADV